MKIILAVLFISLIGCSNNKKICFYKSDLETLENMYKTEGCLDCSSEMIKHCDVLKIK